MGSMSPMHWLIVALAFVLLFGAKKLPEMARSLGQSARVFKSEIKGMQADDEARAKPADPPAQQAPAPQAALPAAQVPASPSAEPKPQAAEGSSASETPR